MLEDLRSRPDRMRLVQRIGVAAGTVLVLLVVYWLTLGKPAPKPKPKIVANPEPALTPGVKDAFEYAKAAQPILDREARYSKVYFVPSAATATQAFGKVVVMGELAGEADLHALQLEMAKFGVPVPVDWQVTVQPPPP